MPFFPLPAMNLTLLVETILLGGPSSLWQSTTLSVTWFPLRHLLRSSLSGLLQLHNTHCWRPGRELRKWLNEIKEGRAWPSDGNFGTGVVCTEPLTPRRGGPGDCCHVNLFFKKTGPGHLLVVRLRDVAINYSCYLILALTDVSPFHCTVITG